MRIIMNIKNIRKAKKVTLSMLQKKSGVSITHINDIENNYKIPSIIIAEKIAKALDVRVVDLYIIDN